MRKALLVVVVILVLVTVGTAVALLNPFGSGGPVPYNGNGVAYAKSPNGLTLGIAISTVSPSSGQSAVVTIAETNDLDTVNNVTAVYSWPSDVTFANAACSDAALPYGIAVFQGNRTVNANTAQLTVFPPMPCPALLRDVSGYLFAPDSSLATILPGNYTVQMVTNITLAGYYSGGTFHPFPAGTYTLMAGDEWGDAAILYFVVR